MSVSVLLAYATTLRSSVPGSCCDKIADTPTGLASTMTNVSFSLEKYDMHEAKVAFSLSKHAWCFGNHMNCAFFLVSSRSGAVKVAKSGIYLLL